MRFKSPRHTRAGNYSLQNIALLNQRLGWFRLVWDPVPAYFAHINRFFFLFFASASANRFLAAALDAFVAISFRRSADSFLALAIAPLLHCSLAESYPRNPQTGLRSQWSVRATRG